MSTLLTPVQAAEKLGYKSAKTFLYAVRTHSIPCIRVSRKTIRFDEAELERYLKGGISR
jgi:excisionase family DNA binding protein